MKNHHLKQFLRDQSGNFALLMGVLAVPITLSIGLAVDTAKLIYTRSILQSAADYAALAASSNPVLSDAELDKIVKDFAQQNGAESVLSTVTSMSGKIDKKNGTFQVVINGEVNPSIMSLAGFSTIAVGVASEVTVGTRAMDVALVLDTTGSMGNPSSKMDSLKSSAGLLLTTLESAKADFTQLRVGVVPFSEYVNVGTDFQDNGTVDTSTADSASWQGCVASRNGPDNTTIYGSSTKYPAVSGVNCTTKSLDLTTDLGAVTSHINSLTTKGNTFIPAGLVWGWNMLTSEAPFTSGYKDSEIAELRAKRAIVLMTDGANTISPGTLLHDGADVDIANTMTANLCSNAKADGIEIFTVSFMVTDTVIQEILNQCASSPSASYKADDGAQLQAAFQDIGTKLAEVRLSQ